VLVAAAGVYAALLSPWWIRNVVVLGHFVPFSTSSAQNLYLGNNPNNIDAGIDWSHDVEPNVAERLLAMPDELERQRAFADRAITYIKAHPVAFIQAAAKKFLRLWNVVPNATEFRGVYALVSALSFGPVLLLAVAGVGWQWRQWRRFSPLLLIIGYFTFVHIVTIASLRYRLPLEPVLIVLAATTLGAVFAKTRQFGHRPA